MLQSSSAYGQVGQRHSVDATKAYGGVSSVLLNLLAYQPPLRVE